MREGGLDDRSHLGDRRDRRALERDESRLDPRTADGTRSAGPGAKPTLRARELDEDGDGAVRLRPRLGEEPIRDLALHHHAPAAQRLDVLERLDDERRRDVVREVGDELRRRGTQRADVDRERVTPHEIDVRPLAEGVAKRGLERAIDLDRVHEPHVIREVAREDAEAGTDLEHDVARARAHSAAR